MCVLWRVLEDSNPKIGKKKKVKGEHGGIQKEEALVRTDTPFRRCAGAGRASVGPEWVRCPKSMCPGKMRVRFASSHPHLPGCLPYPSLWARFSLPALKNTLHFKQVFGFTFI